MEVPERFGVGPDSYILVDRSYIGSTVSGHGTHPRQGLVVHITPRKAEVVAASEIVAASQVVAAIITKSSNPPQGFIRYVPFPRSPPSSS